MSKIIVSKKVAVELEKVLEFQNDYTAIGFLIKNSNINDKESVLAVEAYLSKGGYEVEKSAEELAKEMYERVLEIKSDNKIADTFREIGFSEGMEWMDENFNLGLNLKDK